MRSIEIGRKNGALIFPMSIFNSCRRACQCNQSRSPLETRSGAKTIVLSATIRTAAEIKKRRFLGIRAHCFTGKSSARKAGLLWRGRRFRWRRRSEDEADWLLHANPFTQLALQFLLRFGR